MEIIIHIDKLVLEFHPFKPKLMVFVTGFETATRFSNVFKWRNLFINNYASFIPLSQGYNKSFIVYYWTIKKGRTVQNRWKPFKYSLTINQIIYRRSCGRAAIRR